MEVDLCPEDPPPKCCLHIGWSCLFFLAGLPSKLLTGEKQAAALDTFGVYTLWYTKVRYQLDFVVLILEVSKNPQLSCCT